MGGIADNDFLNKYYTKFLQSKAYTENIYSKWVYLTHFLVHFICLCNETKKNMSCCNQEMYYVRPCKQLDEIFHHEEKVAKL